MDISTISEIASSQTVWAILCIALVIYVMKRSEQRENRLMEHLERSNDSQEKTAIALDGINKNLSKLESRVDNIEKINK
ncbi:BhlA/UviB family holin-like peptide [Rummeliibacillus sp. NPDC094406]|uniref:BhlA/UviB family holin-like peptide n=1 Tax=Rummeliibacillus sp. NPDC094406 TaxID=3364511 RepID=UPI0038050FB5